MILKRAGIAAVTIMMAVTASVVVAGPAQAAVPEPAASSTVTTQPTEVDAFADAIIRLEPTIVRRQDGTLAIRTSARRAGWW